MCYHYITGSVNASDFSQQEAKANAANKRLAECKKGMTTRINSSRGNTMAGFKKVTKDIRARSYDVSISVK